MSQRKSAAYWEGYNAEAARHGRPVDFASLAQSVASALVRDNGRKQRIVARSPGIFSSMDAKEFGEASSTELARRELKALGIDPGDNDPLMILDAHHAGRKHARDYEIPGGRLVGGNTIQGGGSPMIGTPGAGAGTQEAHDASEGARKIREMFEGKAHDADESLTEKLAKHYGI
jgi:hypothetical protein